MRAVRNENIINRDENVESARENRSFFSRKLANGKKRSAISAEKKKGAKMVLPILARYPNASMLISTNANFRTKGNLISFIAQSN